MLIYTKENHANVVDCQTTFNTTHNYFGTVVGVIFCISVNGMINVIVKLFIECNPLDVNSVVL